jgi:hypothetical protein
VSIYVTGVTNEDRTVQILYFGLLLKDPFGINPFTAGWDFRSLRSLRSLRRNFLEVKTAEK